jgi:hypothetical protein
MPHRVIDVHASHDGTLWQVTVGKLGTTAAHTPSGVLKAARDHAFLSGVPQADDREYRITWTLPADDDLCGLVSRAQDRNSNPDTRRDAARRLHAELGYNRSDIAAILGYSHQWVSMLLSEPDDATQN